jgi:prophage antirepressor-like protein
MNDQALKKFDFHGASVRTVTIKGEPWFVAGDVCEILGIENVGNALSRIKKDDIRSADVTDSIGRQQKTKIVSESGLYRIIFQSRSARRISLRSSAIEQSGLTMTLQRLVHRQSQCLSVSESQPIPLE